VNAKIVGASKAAAVRSAMGEAKAELAKKVPGLEVSVNGEKGAPGMISNSKGALVQTKGAKAEDAIKSFVGENHKLFGLPDAAADQLKTKSSYSNPDNKLHWVHLTQEIGGVPVFQGELKALVNENGEVTAITNELAPGLDDSAAKSSVALRAEDAIAAAAANVGSKLDAAALVRQGTSEDGQSIDFKPTGTATTIRARQVLFPLAVGEAQPAFEIVLQVDGHLYGFVVDAESGEILYRKLMEAHQSQTASYLIYDGDSPAPATAPPALPTVPDPDPSCPQPGPQADAVGQVPYTVVSENATASPEGWITDFENATKGNNVWAGLDQFDPDGIDQGVIGASQYSVATGNSNGPSLFNRNFLFPASPPPAGLDQPTLGDMTDYNSAVVTNMFFWTNRYHDYMYRLGFTEAAGNFQSKNFGKGGSGNDLVLAQGQDSSGTDNANFLTPPDGIAPTMQMYNWGNAGQYRDSGLDQHVMLHELTHGLSNRLIGNAFGLGYTQGGGMGEGWSDFYSVSIMSEFPAGHDQDPDHTVAMGGWIAQTQGNFDNYFYGAYRMFPYSTDHTRNPMTFSDTDPAQFTTKESSGNVPESPLCLSRGGGEVHNIGNIWATILWQARAAMMNAFDAARAKNGSFGTQVAAWFAGNRHMLQVVTDGLKLTPTNPTLVEARNAILTAALAQTTTAPLGVAWTSADSANPTIAQMDELALWKGFADRGLGYDAVSPGRFDGIRTELEPINYYTVSRSGCVGDTRTFGPPVKADILDKLKDDDSFHFVFPAGKTFTFYGKVYSGIWVNTNGTITFEREDLDTEVSWQHHFDQPRISGILADFDGATTQGTISVHATGNSVAVLFRNVPDKASVQPDGTGNKNNFQITLFYDVVIPQLDIYNFGPFKIEYGTCETQPTYTGLSNGGILRGPIFDDLAPPTEDLSAYGLCNPSLPPSFFAEAFDPDANPFDLEGLTFNYTYDLPTGWTSSPVESFNVPLKPLAAKVQNTNGSEVVNAGDEVLVQIPLDNKFKKANLTNVLGLITPLTDGVTIIDPVSFYGDIDAGQTAQGSDPFRIALDPNLISCGQKIRLKVDFTCDQGLVGAQRDVLISVGTGFGNPQGTLNYPQGDPAGKLAQDITAAATSAQLTANDAGTTNMKGGLYMKNTRTNEIIRTSFWNTNTRVLTFQRAQKGTLAAAMQAGDVLQYDSVPIPDAIQAGVQFGVKPTDPNITGPVGRLRVTLKKFSHPHVQDLKFTLSNAQGYSIVLADGIKASLDGHTTFQNITFDADANLSIQTNAGLTDNTSYRPVGDFSVFANAAVNAGTTWTLTVSDLVAPFAGDFTGWSIELSPFVKCPNQTVQTSNFDLGASGWTTDRYGDAAQMDAYYRPATANVPAALVLNTKPDNSVRVPGFRSPGVFLPTFENAVYRFHAYVARSGQPDMTKQEQIPFLRIRASVGSVMSNVHDYFFNTTQVDPAANNYTLSEAPSTDPKHPSHYWVDLDPIDAPSLYSDASHTVQGYVENWSHFPTQQGNLEILQSSIERYVAPVDEEGTVVCSYTASDLAHGTIWAGNMANPVWEHNLPYATPSCTTSTLGVTLDSTRVQPVGQLAWVTYDIQPQGKQETVIQPNKLYRVRYHVSSNTPSAENPVLRLRARALRWADGHELVLGPSNLGAERDQLLAREALPGVGTKNPNRRGEETQGGYYDQYISSPLVVPSNVDFKTLRFGFDLFDLGYDGNGTDAQKAEGGRFTLDSIEVREFSQR
jgi:hypothetical protein